MPGQSLSFTICDLPLPNSSFAAADENLVAAGLGYVAHVVYLLSFYLSVPLPYAIQPRLSTSVIQDTISLMPGPRTFPLYLENTVQYRFDYAVFLLNKDIECLMNQQGLRGLDLRHTLPNLKYLLYVLAAGNDALPARKAGGVRGLLLGRTMMAMSRTPSDGSISSELDQDTRRLVREEKARHASVAGTNLNYKAKTAGLRSRSPFRSEGAMMH